MLATDIGFENLGSWLQVLQRIVEHSANMVVITDREQRIRWVNRAYSAVTGWPLDEVLGRRASEFLHGPLTSQRATAQLKTALSGGRAVSGIELVNYRKDGQAYTVLLNIEPIHDGHGNVAAFFSIQTDISERKRLELANASLQRHLDAAQKLARLGRVEYDHESARTRWSHEVFELLDRAPDDAPHDFAELMEAVPPERREGLRHKLAQSLRTGEAFDEEFPLLSAQGQRRWVRCRGIPDFSGEGYRLPATWTVQDVTVYYELLEERQRANETLNRVVGERTRQLEEANRTLTDFSHAISHDLKKPIRHMVSFAEILQSMLDTNDLEQARLYGEKVRAAGRHLQALVEALLRFSRLGRHAVDKQPLALRQTIEPLVAETLATHPGRRIEFSGLDSLPVVMADPVLIHEVWVNLIDNAVKYAAQRDPTRIAFGCREEAAGWDVWIQDNGRGFDPSQHERILQMFGRACEDPEIAGDGIGLALTQQIVDSHGGRLWGESVPGEGATFHVWLPKPRAA